MKRILIVDDDRENVEVLTQYLAHEGHSVQGAHDSESALHRIRAWKPHLVLLDVCMPGVSGVELVPKARAAAGDEYTAIILVSGSLGPEDVTAGIAAGADDYLAKPFRTQELLSRVRAMLKIKELQDSLRRATHRVEELAATDELTGLLSLRAIFRKGEDELARATRGRRSLALMVIDLDGFFEVNQKASFSFGNDCLQETGQRIRACLRANDLLARSGGDEFVALLPEADLETARGIAEKIREAIRTSVFKDQNHHVSLTAGIGVTAHSPDQPEQKLNGLMQFACQALRSAKKAGPDRVETLNTAW